MSRDPAERDHRCEKCGETFTSMMRLQHHQAAEHAMKTMRDVRTDRDIKVAARRAPRLSGGIPAVHRRP